MAVKAAKGAVQGTEEIINAAVARSKAVMMRQWAVYDHEKVFWNSTWTVGLIGLGWLTIKLGQMIKMAGQALSTAWDWVNNPVKSKSFEIMNMIYDYVDEKGSKADPEKWPAQEGTYNWWTAIVGGVVGGPVLGMGLAFGSMSEEFLKMSAVAYYRKNPEEYKKLKAKLISDGWSPPTAAGALPTTPTDILDLLDKFFNAYGPILPFAAVLGHMGLESVRVYRTRKKLGAEL